MWKYICHFRSQWREDSLIYFLASSSFLPLFSRSSAVPNVRLLIPTYCPCTPSLYIRLLGSVSSLHTSHMYMLFMLGAIHACWSLMLANLYTSDLCLFFFPTAKWHEFILHRATLCPRAVSGIESRCCTQTSRRGWSCILNSLNGCRWKKRSFSVNV